MTDTGLNNIQALKEFWEHIQKIWLAIEHKIEFEEWDQGDTTVNLGLHNIICQHQIKWI